MTTREEEAASPGVATHEAMQRAARSMDRTLHDLGQPLTSLALAMELVAMETDPDAQQSLLREARKQCARAIDDVAELRRQTMNLLHLTENSERPGA